MGKGPTRGMTDETSAKHYTRVSWNILSALGSHSAGWQVASIDSVSWVAVVVQLLSLVQLFATPCTVARQAPLSMGFPRQEYWSGLPFPSLGDFPNPRIKSQSLASSALVGRFFTSSLFLNIYLVICSIDVSEFINPFSSTQVVSSFSLRQLPVIFQYLLIAIPMASYISALISKSCCCC